MPLNKQDSSIESITIFPKRKTANYHINKTYQPQANISQNQAWEYPNIFTIDSWLNHLHIAAQEQGIGKPLRLQNRFEEIMLWQKSAPEGTPYALINIAMQAWRFMHYCCIEENCQPTTFAHQDNLMFWQWQNNFSSLLTNKALITTAQLPNYLESWIADIFISHKPIHIQLIGFIEIPPAIDKLLQKIASTHSAQYEFKDTVQTNTAPQPTNPTSQHFAFSSTDIELEHCASWALQQSTAQKEVAIILPTLPQQKQENILSLFDNYLNPHLQSERIFKLHSQKSLAEHKPIIDAKNILKWIVNKISIEQLSSFLTSSSINAGPLTPKAYTENSHILENIVLQKFPLFHSMKELHDILHANPNYHSTQLYKQTSKIKSLATLPEKAQFNDWITCFIQYLACFKWPGENLTVEEDILYNEWISALKTLTKLTIYENPISITEALNTFNNYIDTINIEFPISSTPYSMPEKIHIMQKQDAIGISFDTIWLPQLTDEHWVNALSPNPMLSFELQQTHQLPNASLQHISQLCFQSFTQLKTQANTVILSYAQTDEQTTLTPYAKVPEFAVKESVTYIDKPPVPPLIAEGNKASSTIHITEELPIPFPIPDNKKLPKAINIIEEQNKCAFRAFAKHRLHLNAIPSRAEIVQPITHGNVIHKIFEVFWKEVETSQQLNQLIDKNKLKEKIISITQNTIHTAMHHLASSIQNAIISRISTTVTELLHEESKRKKDFKIAEIETQYTTTLKGLEIKFKVDRIDYDTNNNSYSIIDYKTGSINPKHWKKETLQAPQLPLYAISIPQLPINNIEFAQIRDRKSKKEIKFTNANHYLKIQSASQWEEQCTQWKKEIENSLERYLNGENALTPIEEKTCEQCSFASLCRIKSYINQAKNTSTKPLCSNEVEERLTQKSNAETIDTNTPV